MWPVPGPTGLPGVFNQMSRRTKPEWNLVRQKLRRTETEVTSCRLMAGFGRAGTVCPAEGPQGLYLEPRHSPWLYPVLSSEEFILLGVKYELENPDNKLF